MKQNVVNAREEDPAAVLGMSNGGASGRHRSHGERSQSKVEKMCETPAPDGMLESPDRAVYLTAFEQNAIVRFDPITKKIDTVVKMRA